MSNRELLGRRLQHQGLSAAPFEAPEDVVGWLGAVQSQEHAVAQWSLGLRCHGVDESSVNQAIAEGRILRTHVLRPTWHYVLPADIRWLVELTAPRVRVLTAYYDRRLELDDQVFARSQDVMQQALRGNNHLTRNEIGSLLEQAGIPARGQRLGNLLMHAELDALVCSGAPRRRQHTYALVSERAPRAMQLSRDEALAELARRYFTSHGPATLNDLRWWSSLPTPDARRAVEIAGHDLDQVVVDGRTYWLGEVSWGTEPAASPAAHLLQGYDEYFSYGESKDLFDAMELPATAPFAFTHALIVDGQVAGRWRRTLRKNGVDIELQLARQLTTDEQDAVEAATQRYRHFLGLTPA